MYIQTETTPNPNSLRFLPGQPILTQAGVGSAEFGSIDAAVHSPLARRLFAIEGVSSIMLGTDFITVTKTADSSWEYLRTLILSSIMDHLTSGMPVIDDTSPVHPEDMETDPIIREIKALLDARVRPAVAQDGGDIEFDSFEDGILYLRMRGACSGCPSSSATLKSGIENMMRHYVPEVLEVRAAL